MNICTLLHNWIQKRCPLGNLDRLQSITMPFKKRKSLGGHRLQRGLEKLQPKWANPTAGKAFYFFFLASVFMEISLLPSVSFWSSEFLFCRFLFLFFLLAS